MNNKQFTDELFKRMYDLGFRKAEIEDDVLFFFCGEREFLNPFLPRVMVASTCFEEKDQLIDIAEYLGIVDWSKVEVDTPVLVSFDGCNWFKKYFAKVQNDTVYTWDNGATSWSVSNKEYCVTSWRYAKLAEV